MTGHAVDVSLGMQDMDSYFVARRRA